MSLTVDLSEPEILQEPERKRGLLDPAEYCGLVLQLNGVSADGMRRAAEGKPFELPGLGLIEFSNPVIGFGGFKGRREGGFKTCLHLHAMAQHGNNLQAATNELRKKKPIPLCVGVGPRIKRAPTAEELEQSDRLVTKRPLSEAMPTCPVCGSLDTWLPRAPGIDEGNLTHWRCSKCQPPPNPTLIKRLAPERWLQNQPPITLEAMIAHECYAGELRLNENRRSGYEVIAFPTRSISTFEIANFQAYAIDGTIPIREEVNPGSWSTAQKKCVITRFGKGQSDSIFASKKSIELLRRGEPIDGLIGLRCEGLKDVLVGWQIAQTCDRPVVVFSNLFGCSTHEIDRPIVERLHRMGCKEMLIVGDCDEAGAVSALRWTENAKQVIPRVRNLQLPFEIIEKRGKDLRDWCQTENPKAWQDLISLPDSRGSV